MENATKATSTNVVGSNSALVFRLIAMAMSAKMALEQIQLRLNTITELGNVVVTLSPAMSEIKGLQGKLSSMMPKADQSLGEISNLLDNIMMSLDTFHSRYSSK